MLFSARLIQAAPQPASAALFSPGHHAMKTTAALPLVICIAACLMCVGCASIISGRHADVAIDSYPTNAHVVVHDNDGRAVASLNTPGVVNLKRNRRFFLPARYTATIEAPGFEVAQVPIHSTVNPWILGNIVIGGGLGLIVDSATGTAWQPRQKEIHRELVPLDGPEFSPAYSTLEPTPKGSTQTTQYVAEQPEQPAGGSEHQREP